MKKNIGIVVIAITLIVPQVAFASWWNPVSWSMFSYLFGNTSPQVLNPTATNTNLSSSSTSATTTKSTTLNKQSKSTKEAIKPVKTEKEQPKGTLCNGVYWSACPVDQKFVCPKSGDAICEISKTDQQVCETDYGPNSLYTGQKNSNGSLSCGCKSGYEWNKNQTSCVVTVVKTGYQVCSEAFANETWDGTYADNGKYNCVCKVGYEWSNTSSSCQIQQQQNVQPVGISNLTSSKGIASRIDGEFNGWNDEVVYKLTNGQYWQQTSYHYYYRYAYSPKVLIYLSNGVYKMHVDGADGHDVTVSQISEVLESRISGEFKGWEGDTMYQLTNGQYWQQSDYHYHYHYAYSPEVLIYKSNSGVIKMHVKGDTDKEISVRRVN